MLLLALCGLFWTLTYAIGVGRGFRDATFAVPVTSITTNISWEFIKTFQLGAGGIQLYINAVWFALDVLLLWQCLRFGPHDFEDPWVRRFFPGILGVALACSYALTWQMGVTLGDPGGVYSAFAGNLLMSILFIAMLLRRRSVAGQSIYLAICKLLGTGFAAAEFHLRNPDNQLLHGLFVTIVFFDVCYIVLLLARARTSGVAIWKRL